METHLYAERCFTVLHRRSDERGDRQDAQAKRSLSNLRVTQRLV